MIGEERDAAWYDEVFATSTDYSKPTAHAPWHPVWVAVSGCVHADAAVLDMGCGPGHVAELLEGKCVSYVGVDFSAVALRQAKGRAPWATFLQHDLVSIPAEVFGGVTHVLLCEVLEHISFDVNLLHGIPGGMTVTLSVPTFDAEGHVRIFKTQESVVSRYGEFIDIDFITTVDDRWHVLHGRAK